MQLFTLLSELVGHIAWPVTLVTFFVMFRREIRQRLVAVTEVKYPGGSIIMREVEKLEAKVEEVTSTTSGRGLSDSTPPALFGTPHSDSRLAIAQMRLELEKELFLIARHSLRQGNLLGWSLDRYIEELEKTGDLDASIADNVRDFASLSNKIIHESAIPDALIQRAVAVGGALVATLRHKRLVLEAEFDFQSHGLWHMHKHLGHRERKFYFWSAVAASLPDLDYDYDIYREAIEKYNTQYGATADGSHDIYVLPLDEFVSVLEFREQELLRIIGIWRSGHAWSRGERDIEWQWPSAWGDLGWSGPILQERVHLWGAEEDLMRTRAALDHYRRRLLALRRAGRV
jgi:hypothetical protein